MPVVTCQNKGCTTQFKAKPADIKRGWGRFCSKSCKAQKQTRDTGYASPRGDGDWHLAGLNAMEEGWDGHKVWTGG